MSQRNLQRVVYSRAKRQPDLKDQYAEGEGTSNTIDRSKRPKFSKPQMDKNTCSGYATDSDSELSLTACLNRFTVLQSSPSPPSSTTRESSSTAKKRRKQRKRTDKRRITETPSPSSAVNEDQPELSSSVSDSDDVPKVQPVGERSSSPGLMQPEAPVERQEAQPTPTTSEPELPLRAPFSTRFNLPLAAANSGECPSDRESVTCNLSSAEEQEPSVAPHRPPSTDEPLLDAPTTLAALSVAAPEDLNGLAESRTELETASHEPSLMPPAALQPQASSPEASTETVPPDMRPQVAVPALLPDLDPKRTLESSTAKKRRKQRKRNNKQMISATSSAVNEDQPEPELSSSVSDSDDVPKVQPVGERSSSPGLMQPEAPVERLEAQPTPTTSEPELPLPATFSTRVNLQLAAANSGECPSDRESVTCNLSSAEEQEPSVAPPRPPSTDEPLLDAPTPLAALSLAAPEDLNGLAESRTELETASHEPSLMPPAALAQPQASSPEASTETVPPDMRPQVAVPALLPDLDPKRTLESSTAKKRRKQRKRNNKQMISATSSAVNEDQPEPELSSSVSDSDDVPKVQPVGERSSSPGPVQPEAPVERLEAQPTPTTSEPELPLPATFSTRVNLPLAAASSGECPSHRESVTCNLSSAEEQEPSVAPPRPPSTDEPLLDAPTTLAALSLAAPEDLNGLAESRTELETASHEPSLMPPAALAQPQASGPEASTETVPPDMRPQVAVPALLPDLDPKRTLESSTAKKRRNGRKRNNKQMISATSSAVNEDQPEPELSSSVSDSDDVPKVQPVGERSSSPGLMQPEAPVERLEAQPTPTTSEPELHLPAPFSTRFNLPLAATNSGECPSHRESVTCNLSSAEEQEPSVAPPRPPSTDEPLLDAPKTLAALSVAAPEDLNGLAESRTELETASHEPSLMPPAALQPQASSPEASTETVPPDMRPQVAVPALLPDLDPKRTLESSTAKKRRKQRKHNNKQMISATSSAVNEDQPEPELSSSVSDSDDVPKVQPVGERSSSPGLMQPEAPVERLEAQPTPTTSEPELPLPATFSTRVNLQLAAANSGECPSDRESVTCNLSSAEEQEPSVAPPRPPSTDEPLLDAPTPLAALSLATPEDLNGLAESRTELETASHEPSLMPPAALAQPQASSLEASTETVPPDMRPQVAVPALLPDLDPKRTLESSTAKKRRKQRKRNNKQMISATSSAVNEDQPEPELSSSVSDSDDVPKVQPVGERSSSPGLVQPEAPVERLEAQPTPTTSEPELHLPATFSTRVNLPLAAASSGECPSHRESVTCNLSSAEEQEPSVVPPRPPSTDEPLLDAPTTLAALSLAAPEDLNGLAESRTELETASHEPSLMPPAALAQPQASSLEASTETVPPDMRPQVAVPALLPDLDPKRTLESTAKKRRKQRKRNNKQMISATSSAVNEDQPEPELSSSVSDSDDVPKVQPVGERSSSPGLMQPEAPVERLEAQPTPTTSEPELPLPATLSTRFNLPLAAANSGECPSDRESVTCNLSSAEEQEPSVAPPRPPSTDEPLLDAPTTLAALSLAAPEDLNGLAESRTELQTVSHEPSLMPPAALAQPQASSPEASTETVPPDMRPQVAVPALLPDLDPKRTLESSTAKKRKKQRKRNNKQMISATSSAVNEDQPEPELSSSVSDSDDVPKVQPVGERSSSPGLMQPEAPVERLEAQPTPTTSEPELPLPATFSKRVNLPLAAANSGECPSDRESATCNLSSAEEQEPSVAPPRPPSTDEPLLDAPTPLAALSLATPEDLNGLAESRTELETASHEPSLMPPAALAQPQASSPEASTETVTPDMRPQVAVPALLPDLDPKRTLESTAKKRRKQRKRNNKQMISATSSAVNEDQPEPELSSSVSDSDDVPKVQPVGERSSSPGLVQPEAPVERLEAQPTPTTSEPELPLPAPFSTRVNLPLAATNSGECPSDRESVTCNLSSAEEQEPSVAPPRPPSTDEPLLDAPTTLAALSVAAPEDLNGLAESRTELETASHEPSLMPPAALAQPQASSPEASTETLPPDMRPQVAVPALLPDLDPKRTLESSTAKKRGKGRKRNNKQMISATSSAVNEDQPEPELSSSVSDSDDVPKVQPVGERSSSPGLMQPEAPVERLEAQPTPTTSEPELHLPAPFGTRVNLPLAATNSGECPSHRESVTCNLSSAEEQEPSVAPPWPPSADEPLLDAPTTLAALSLAAPEDLNGLAESRTELQTVSHEPSLMPPAALAQPQASSPEASTDTVPPDMRPQVAVPALLPDLDPKRTLESSTAKKRRKQRKRNNKQMISATSSAVNEDQPEPELSSSVSDSDDVPKVQPVGERSSSPGLMQPEAPVERLEVQPTPLAYEPELHLPATLSTRVNLPLAAANSGECPSDRDSATCNLSSAEEQEPSVAPPRPPSTDKPLLDAPRTLAALSVAATEDLDAKRTLETQKSSSPYLRELMAAVCKAAVKENTTCRVHAALLQRRMPVTLEYRYSERERQMKALRELQALIVALDQPPDLLRIFFHCMYDKDVSSKDTYCKSGAAKELADQLGNGVALKTVTAFFTWLREAESQPD
ncbi:mucin-2-like [Platichthys flesus]|uniref:mucin-2-like n=1 Tax=Platichthys flesus TaxID=8260 RepID=UPI002DBF0DD5|nr:mucin-2-like [Platichthys flesus]